MASPDNPRLPLTSGTSHVVKYMEMRNETQSLSTSIAITATTSSSPNPAKSKHSLPMNEYELRRMPTRQRRVVKKTLMANVGYRLGKRKTLHIQRLKKILVFLFYSNSLFAFIGDLLAI
jgi:hypothetical protein